MKTDCYKKPKKTNKTVKSTAIIIIIFHVLDRAKSIQCAWSRRAKIVSRRKNRTSTHVQSWGPVQYLSIRNSSRMFFKSINSKEFPGGVFEWNGDFSSASLGLIVAHLVGRYMHAANQSGLITLPESPLRCRVFWISGINTNCIW